MSETIPSTSTSNNSPQDNKDQPKHQHHHHHHKKSRRRYYDKSKLPTPPPDPTELKAQNDRQDFLAYLDSLQKSSSVGYSRSTSTFAPVIATEDAFDHLEKLYKLMEQMLELRDQNAKLHRRVRDLEHLNNLERMHKELDVDRDCPELEKDTAFAETILESILAETKLVPQKSKISASSRLRQSISRKPRNRSGSVSCGDKQLDLDVPQEGKDTRRASTCVDNRDNDAGKPSKVSKWTKVKAAFKWEKASPTVSDAKSQDSGISGMVPVNLEVARYLRVPSTCEDASGHSPADSGAAEISTPGSLSTASSTEDFHRNDLRIPCEDLRSSDEEHSHNYIPHSKNGSQKSNKSHKTPWAKMKDIIQTRNSFKKKHRLSAQSDDIQIDVELCSDNEDVFEDVDDKNCSTSPPSPRQVYRRVNSSEVPPEVVARYQRAIVSEDGTVSEAKKISKWTRVKKAFLTPGDSSPQEGSSSTSPLRKISNVGSDEGKSVHAEIQRNYEQLQQKLSLEFQEKLNEWERMKQNSPGISSPSSVCGFVDDTKDPAFIKKMEEWQRIKSQPSIKNRPNIQMKSEEELPPEFRKKLEEWKKIRKNSGKESNNNPKKKIGEVPRWKSISGHKTDTHFEYSQLSEDFRKKLEEWKQIKSTGGVSPAPLEEDKKKDVNKSSPRLTRKNLSPKHSKKNPQDKELQWYERELGKIEKEKQRLERERQKFLEREERLSKLRNSVIGGLKKEVLIHTPSGFYRFEGISRKFTQKLYEWEKAQGIAPESSTFALLSSSLRQESKANPKCNNSGMTASLVRSKSADSIAISALNLACPLMSHQPSSLSLNDVDELEKECLADSKSSSAQFLSRESLDDPVDEPEALIVEVEDIVEETAAPLRTYAQKIQQPVYQRQELKTMCEGETCVGPKVRRSESARAQNNYNLIEEINNILRKITENELEIQRTQDSFMEHMNTKKSNENVFKLKSYDHCQKSSSSHLNKKISKLQDANTNVASNLNKEDTENTSSHLIEALELVQDLSNEIFQLGEKLETEINNRNIYDTFRECGARSLTPIMEIIKDLQSKMLKLRRGLSYVCAASDVTTPRRKRSSKKKTVKKTISNESKDSESSNKNEKPRLYVKSETSNNTQSQGAVKKRIRYRQKSTQNRSLPDSDEEDENVEIQRNNPHKKLTRTRSVSESSVGKVDDSPKILDKSEEVVVEVDEAVIQKVVVPTKTNFVNSNNNSIEKSSSDSPVTVFVKTTRKLFTPLIESGNKSECINPQQKDEKNSSEQSSSETISERTIGNISPSSVTRLPPLPSSPTIQRKASKDISPSIRVMLAKYNQKISELDLIPNKSGGSSESASPVAWRSPTSERRVKAQTERYQEELDKLSPLMAQREVQKSASAGYLQAIKRRNSVSNENGKNDIAKSSSVSVFHNRLGFQNSTKSDSSRANTPSPRNITERKTSSLTVVTDFPDTKGEVKMRHSPEIRLRKLQKAKEEFLKSTPCSAPPQMHSGGIKFPTRNRLSQISVESESSYDSSCAAGALIKSASAGMINIDADTYRQIDPEIHDRGYVSLPRSATKRSGLGGKFAFSNIASKFRKVKMRKGKDKDKGAISALCRQSLVVDINKSPNQNKHFNEDVPISAESMEVSSEDVSSTSSSKTGSWIRKPKLFRKN